MTLAEQLIDQHLGEAQAPKVDEATRKITLSEVKRLTGLTERQLMYELLEEVGA